MSSPRWGRWGPPSAVPLCSNPEPRGGLFVGTQLWVTQRVPSQSLPLRPLHPTQTAALLAFGYRRAPRVQGMGGGCGPWARGVGHRCAASPLRGDGLLISTQIGVLSGDYHRALPGYRSAPTFAPRLRAPTLPCVRRAERGGAVPNLFASPPHSSCKKKQQKKPNPQLLQTLFLSPSWNQCGIFVAGIWRGRSRAGMWRRH